MIDWFESVALVFNQVANEVKVIWLNSTSSELGLSAKKKKNDTVVALA